MNGSQLILLAALGVVGLMIYQDITSQSGSNGSSTNLAPQIQDGSNNADSSNPTGTTTTANAGGDNSNPGGGDNTTDDGGNTDGADDGGGSDGGGDD